MRKLWIAALLTACATPQWEKTGTAPDEIARELKQCEAAAPPAPRAAPGPRSNPASNVIDFDSASERSFERMRKDDEYVAACMRAKGYRR
jgi:hypothetical protein